MGIWMVYASTGLSGVGCKAGRMYGKGKTGIRVIMSGEERRVMLRGSDECGNMMLRR